MQQPPRSAATYPRLIPFLSRAAPHSLVLFQVQFDYVYQEELLREIVFTSSTIAAATNALQPLDQYIAGDTAINWPDVLQ